MRESTKVILWGREDIICQGVELFLRSHCNVEIRRIIGEDDYEILLQELERERADVVIINPSQQHGNQRYPLQLMKMYSGIKIITLDLEDSSVDVYNRQKVCMKQVSDLLDLVN